MESVQQYILSVLCAVILCTIVSALLGKKNTVSSLVRLLTGLYLSITVLSPLLHFPSIDLMGYWDSINADSAAAVSLGEEEARSVKSGIIKENAAAYVLEKAESMGLNLEVLVTLNDELAPTCITVTGSAAPYEKQQLTQIIASDLGIPKENQTWN